MAFSKDWQEALELCSTHVREAVSPLIGGVEASFTVGRGAGGDLTLKIDSVAEGAILNFLKEIGFKGVLVSEEVGFKKFGDEEAFIIADPIDGSINASRGLPAFCTSLAYSKGLRISDVEVGVVMSLVNGDVYKAVKGCGAYVNGGPLKTSVVGMLEEAVVGIDINFKGRADYLELIKPLCLKAGHLRHIGSNVLELCFLARGVIDAFIDLRGILRSIDIAAASLIVKEAGGIVTDAEGSQLDANLEATTRVSLIAAGCRELSYEILRLLTK